ncbi:hypothetical protein [Shewanella woodyi]|uniref:hypothetical protein n=1 Tax=Shewanella woodyi TaxID=60961 RepID=UPI0009EDE55F|nr:hypothetical protein [Shewanella woodyi]
MKNTIATRSILLLVAALTSPLVAAHPGHDHQHWSASLIHLLWILPAVIAIGALFHLYRRKRTQSDKG